MTADLQHGASLVLSHINNLIDTGEIRPNSKLPAERVLAERLGCTRNDVRNAMAYLESEGKVTRHVGRGTFLNPNQSSISKSIIASPAELMSARQLLEPSIAGMAAMTANELDFQEMLRCLEGGDNNDGYDEFEEWDIALHRSFALATHNAIIVAMLDLLHSSRNDPVWGDVKKKSFSLATCQGYREEHRDIVNAIMGRDRDKADAAMLRHLNSIRNNIGL